MAVLIVNTDRHNATSYFEPTSMILTYLDEIDEFSGEKTEGCVESTHGQRIAFE